jgi:uncharacterized protein with PIN domain
LAFDEEEVHQTPKKHNGNADGSLNKHAVERIWYGLGVIESMSKTERSSAVARGEIKFAADRMLGRLAKWLRVLGFDVIYGQHLTGYGLIRAARAEARLILTRDRSLKQKQPPPFIFVDSDHYGDQLRQVIRECGLKPGEGLFSRCLECNAVLQPRNKETVQKLVPPYVYASQDSFSWCPVCQRVYWPATHHEKMLAALRKIAVL